MNRGRRLPISCACVLHSQTWVKEIVNSKEKSSLNLPRRHTVSTEKLSLFCGYCFSVDCAFMPVCFHYMAKYTASGYFAERCSGVPGDA